MKLLDVVGLLPKGFASTPDYQVVLASSPELVRAAQRLRFEMFNLELQEGLLSSYATALDSDPFDAICSHLVVLHSPSDTVVGTYRMQTGTTAQQALGYYCAQEFDLSVFEHLRSEVLELGRACIAKEHRNFTVLSMLWRGIVQYAQAHGARYLLGCSSLTSQDAALAQSAYAAMQNNLAPQVYRTTPLANYACEGTHTALPTFKAPKLLSAYLALGAWICGPPAIDRAFQTIDFLTLMDLQSPEMALRRKRFGISL